MRHPERGKMTEKIKGMFGKCSSRKRTWECDTWKTEIFPPVADGFKYVSIEVEVRLESGKIVPAVYARGDGYWYLAEGTYPRIQEEVIEWRRKTC